MKAPRCLIACVLLAGAARPAGAQAAWERSQAGVRAYQNLRYAQAATLFRSALGRADTELTREQRSETSSYLVAALLLGGRRDSAVAAAAALIRERPRYHPDSLIFPPEVTGLVAGLAHRLRVLRVDVPPDAAIRPGAERWVARLETSTPQDIEASIRNEAGTVLTLYRGAIEDTLSVSWSGLDQTGRVPAPGRYWLTVVRRDDQTPGAVRRELDLRWDAPDTLPHPPPPPDSLLLPERLGAAPAVRAVASGLAASAVIVLGAGLLAPHTSLSPTRFAVAGAVDLVALAGALRHLHGQPIEANRRANAEQRERWRARVDSTRAENRRRRESARLRIQAGSP